MSASKFRFAMEVESPNQTGLVSMTQVMAEHISMCRVSIHVPIVLPLLVAVFLSKSAST